MHILEAIRKTGHTLLRLGEHIVEHLLTVEIPVGKFNLVLNAGSTREISVIAGEGKRAPRDSVTVMPSNTL